MLLVSFKTANVTLGINMPSKKEMLQSLEQKAMAADQTKEPPIIGREYFRNPEVNLGFYSKKRDGVADVDPKVRLLNFL